MKTAMMTMMKSLMTGPLALVELEAWAFGQDASRNCV
jgi:hypothetical protein